MASAKVKTFDEVLESAKKESRKRLRDACKTLEGEEKIRVDAMLAMTTFDEKFSINDKSKKINKTEKDDTLIYKCNKPTYIEEKSKHFDKIVIETSDVVKIASKLNTKNLEIKNCENKPLHGRIVFEKTQKVLSLAIKNVAVRGKFNVPKVTVDALTYLDLYLDVDDKYELTELNVHKKSDDIFNSGWDRFDKNIRGNIDLSKDFYIKLSEENKKELVKDCQDTAINMRIEGIPIHIYNSIKYKKIDIEIARDELMTYSKKFAKSLSKDVLDAIVR